MTQTQTYKMIIVAAVFVFALAMFGVAHATLVSIGELNISSAEGFAIRNTGSNVFSNLFGADESGYYFDIPSGVRPQDVTITYNINIYSDSGSVSIPTVWVREANAANTSSGETSSGSSAGSPARSSGGGAQGSGGSAGGGAGGAQGSGGNSSAGSGQSGQSSENNQQSSSSAGSGSFEGQGQGDSSVFLPPPPPPGGSISVSPTLLRGGDAAEVSWNTQNTSSCTVSGDNGDVFSGRNGTVQSSPIAQKTIYTLSCDGGALTDTAVVNVIPKFEEI